jgi:hypothetical protein
MVYYGIMTKFLPYIFHIEIFHEDVTEFGQKFHG